MRNRRVLSDVRTVGEGLYVFSHFVCRVGHAGYLRHELGIVRAEGDLDRISIGAGGGGLELAEHQRSEQSGKRKGSNLRHGAISFSRNVALIQKKWRPV